MTARASEPPPATTMRGVPGSGCSQGVQRGGATGLGEIELGHDGVERHPAEHLERRPESTHDGDACRRLGGEQGRSHAIACRLVGVDEQDAERGLEQRRHPRGVTSRGISLADPSDNPASV